MKQKSIYTIIVCLVVTTMMAQEIRYVDLGLPSGILWACQNEPGVYTFEETINKFSGKEMPGMREFQELVDHCTWKWNGSGYTIVGTNGDSIILPMEPYIDCQGNRAKDTTRGYYWSAEAYDELEGWGLYFSLDRVYTNMSFIKCMALPVRKIQHPVQTYQIPDYDKIQKIGQNRIIELTHTTNNYLKSLATKKNTYEDIKADMALKCLKGKEYIHSIGKWDEYINYLNEELDK